MKRVPKAQKEGLMKQLAQLTQSVQACLYTRQLYTNMRGAPYSQPAGAPPICI